VWLLVKDQRALLAPAKGALGVAGTKLVEPLLEIIEKVGGWARTGKWPWLSDV
jgi:hypothetical protein